MNNNSTSSHERPSCPCKRLPLVLSSFTAAEHGQVQALMMRHNNNNKTTTTTTTTTTLAERQDAYGNTPLHLAAQHGHVAATAMLLQVANCRVNAQASGATPLHRAAFSGAVATMQLLLNHNRNNCDSEQEGEGDKGEECSLLVQDSSFGDFMTPLHKAASGGRYLAVQLLLDAHQVRQSLPQALSTVDAVGRTPLQVAMDKNRNATVERQSVARWDTVAGHVVADWEKCIQLLQQAAQTAAAVVQQECHDDDDFENNNSNNTVNTKSPGHERRNIIQAKQQQQLPEMPSSLSSSRRDDCLDCTTEDGRCLTRSWETQFWSALSQSTDEQLSKNKATNPIIMDDGDGNSSLLNNNNNNNEKNLVDNNKINNAADQGEEEDNAVIIIDKHNSANKNKQGDHRHERIMNNENNDVDKNNHVTAESSYSPPPSLPSSSSLGRLCSSCQTHTFALYPSTTGGLLVCKKCQRKGRRPVRTHY